MVERLLGAIVYMASTARSRYTSLGLRILAFYWSNDGTSNVVCDTGQYSASPCASEVVRPQPTFWLLVTLTPCYI